MAEAGRGPDTPHPPRPKRIRIVTTTRAEWHLLATVVRELASRQAGGAAIDVAVIAGGTHLLTQFGETVREVRAEAQCPIVEVDFIDRKGALPADHLGMTRMMGRAVTAFADCFAVENPDLVVVLGDRFEIMSAALAAVSLRIALVHIEGGHVTQGAIDERYRHAITKLADLHFPALPAQRKRLIAMGEAPERIIASGAIGAAQARQALPLPARDMIAATGFDPRKRPIVVATFHSETATDMRAEDVVSFITELVTRSLAASQPPPAYLFTMANLDPGGAVINRGLEQVARRFPDDVRVTPSIGHSYLRVLASAAGVIGNSSSGILEAAAMDIPVINVGRRQEGRDRYGDVTDCRWTVDDALAGVDSMVTLWAAGERRAPGRSRSDNAPWVVIADGIVDFDTQGSAGKIYMFPSIEDK